jgi:hypothetical protein
MDISMRISLIVKRFVGLIRGDLHHYMAQRIIRKPKNRERISKLISHTKPKTRDTSPLNLKVLSEKLSFDGYLLLPKIISEDEINDINFYLQDKLCYDRNKPYLTTKFPPKEVPIGTHIGAYSDADVVKCPHILKIANNRELIQLIELQFGCKPTISNMSIWWSFETTEAPEEAENFHRDIDDWHQLKLFIYLTSVDSGTGPHVFVKNSHRVDLAYETRRYADNEIVQAFGQNRIINFVGPQGTAFIENTFGLHKGSPARTGDRLLLQVLYTLNPLGVSDYRPISIEKSNINIDKYINRLYVK